MNYQLKKYNEDFLVSEALILDIDASDGGSYRYFRLRKRNLTTFSAIAIIAKYFSLPSQVIGYAGLKDEDAVTDQYISIAQDIASDKIAQFNRDQLTASTETFVTLMALGSGENPMEVGRLLGNGFKIIVRNLDPDLAEKLSAKRHHVSFLNYYDLQRFGVPGGKRVTHLVGKALLENHYENALEWLIASDSPESAAAVQWQGTAEGFFAQLDARIVSFYRSAYASSIWNIDLAERLDAKFPDENRREMRESL
jgi:tRNA pseudouridine13 synthase